MKSFVCSLCHNSVNDFFTILGVDFFTNFGESNRPMHLIHPLFLLPLSMTFVETTYSVSTVCVLAIIAALQEVYFVERGKEVL